jgi:hypothetical protein
MMANPMPAERRRAGASRTARRMAVAGLALLCLLASVAGHGVRWPDRDALVAALPRLDLAVSVRVTIEPGQLAQAMAGAVRR